MYIVALLSQKSINKVINNFLNNKHNFENIFIENEKNIRQNYSYLILSILQFSHICLV